MTNIAYIRGIPGIGLKEQLGEETSSSYGIVAPAPALDYLQMTAGEVRVALLADQLRILGEYYGNTEQIQEAQRLVDLLAAGFHNAPTADAGSTIPAVNRAIRRARGKNRPAAATFIRADRRAGLPEAAIAGIRAEAGIGEVIIPYQSCEQYIEYVPVNPNDPYGPQQAQYQDGYTQCVQLQEYVNMLNQRLTPSSHHLLYEYAPAFGEPGSVSAKRVLHRNAVSTLAQISTLDRESLRGWIRNAIMRNNAQNGTNPWQPEDTYYILRTGTEADQIGAVPLAAVLSAIVKVVGAITAAVVATKALIDALKNPDRLLIQNTAQGIGTPTFGPEQSDFFRQQQQPGATGAGSNLLLPVAAAAAVLLIAK